MGRLHDMIEERRFVIMGVLNVTSDSFFDGGRYDDTDAAVKRGLELIEEGADILDVGGESTRPGSEPVSEEEEIKRVVPVIEMLRAKTDRLISIDTYKPRVAEMALAAGADIVNDVKGLDYEMAKAISKKNASVVIMHMRGEPRTMQKDIKYEKGTIAEIKDYLADKIDLAVRFGIQDIAIDPGIGFGKTVDDNIELIRSIKDFRDLGYPVLIGLSRKSFLGRITGAEVDDRLIETVAANTVALMNGAEIIRVHDVKEARKTVEIVKRMISGTGK